jgi:two-component system OmpR family sensor kinase
MMVRELFDATIGRRLVFRIWAHGLALFGGVIATVWIARWLMTDLDATSTMRAHPYIAARVVDRVLTKADEPGALARELAVMREQTRLAISVFAPGGRLLASSSDPPLAAPSVAETSALEAGREVAAWSDDRMVVGRFRDDNTLSAIAAVRAPPGPSFHLHLAALHLAALVLAFVFVAFPLARSIARPIERLGNLARELGAGNLDVRTNSGRRDEIGDLARSFDTMAGQIRNLRAAERQLLGDVSHELRTPLARMRVVLDLASDAELDRVRSYLREITTDLGELEQLIDDIIGSLQLDPAAGRWNEARPPLRRNPTSIDDLVDASIARFRARWLDRALVDRRKAHCLTVDGDPAMLRRVLDNLLDNARKFSAADAPITIEVVRCAGERHDSVHVEVIDRGSGIPLEDHDRVFSTFYRADRSRTRASGGVGLGLALARRIVEAHGGTIGFTSEPHRGSRFWFELALSSSVDKAA